MASSVVPYTSFASISTDPAVSSSSTAQPSLHPPSGINTAAIVGGVLGGVVVVIVVVAMIVPCARHRQKRLRAQNDAYGGPRVLRKAVDPETTEPMMKNGSWKSHGRVSEDRLRSIDSGHTLIPPGYIEPLPIPTFQTLQPVREDALMGNQNNYHSSATYLPQPTSPISPKDQRPGQSRFPSLDKLWPLTSAFRTSIYSSPSTKTKSSAASSAPSRSNSRHHSRRGRKDRTKQINPEALTSHTVLGREVRLGRSRAPADMEIKHARAANEVKYETAPLHKGFSLHNTGTFPPHRDPPSAYVQPRPSNSHNHDPRRQPSANADPRHHKRERSSESHPHSRSNSHTNSTGHHKRRSSERSAHSHTPQSRSRSRDRTTPTKSSLRAGSSGTKVYHHDGQR